ncbi:MAG TPA: proteasome subunit beta, partial [Methanoregula sp.]|nr:proteasome subunit beta [Methanoregula sp.]
GVLEDRYRKNMAEDEAIDIAVRGLKSAMKRDAGSGEGIQVVVITKEKYHVLGEEELKKYLAKAPA